MGIAKVGEIFNCVLTEADKSFLSADVLSCNIDRESRKMVVNCRSNEYIPAADLNMIKTKLSEKLSLSKLQVNIIYDENCFCEAAIVDLVHEIKAKNAALNGFFNEAKYIVDNNVLRISLCYGGLDAINGTSFEVDFKKILKNRFNKTLDIIFEGQTKEVEMIIPQAEYIAPSPIEYKPQISNEQVEKTAVDVDNLPIDLNDIKVLYGHKIRGIPIPMSNVMTDGETIVVWGEIFKYETAPTKKGDKQRVEFQFSDLTNSMTVKTYVKNEDVEKLSDLKNGVPVLVRGTYQYDNWDKDYIIRPISINIIRRKRKMDMAKVKRVELHAHTNMSAMDGVVPAGKLIERAFEWGHSAVAITDHGVVQAFPEAMNTWKSIKKRPGGENFKVIYGVEAYFVDDMISAVCGETDMAIDGCYIVFDVETTGLNFNVDRLTEIGAVKVKKGEVVESFSTFVNPHMPIPQKITELTGIDNTMVDNAPDENEAVENFLEFCGDGVLVAHNAKFDISFISAAAKRSSIEFNPCYIDTVMMARKLLPDLKNHKLDNVAKALGLRSFNHHRASDDAGILSEIFSKLLDKTQDIKKCRTVMELNDVFCNADPRKLKRYHQILLVKTQAGLKNLYKIVSEAHLKYFSKRPIVPRSLLNKYRDGLIVGSACEQGELYSAVIEGRSMAQLIKIAEYYDYLEIQPLGNNEFMVRENMCESMQEIMEYNKMIVMLGDRISKPVVATGDVHFLNKEDEAARRILMAGQGFKDADSQAPLYFKSTDEM
ncbi:MAG: PHP domain-containing protein, partial [Oscillospiraceae bacterium]